MFEVVVCGGVVADEIILKSVPAIYSTLCISFKNQSPEPQEQLMQPLASSQYPECSKFSATNKNTDDHNNPLSDKAYCALDSKHFGTNTNLEKLIEVRHL